MRYNLSKKTLAFSSLAIIATSNAFAGNLTTGKGTYDFTAEYTGNFKDENGKSNGVYAQGLEIDNTFGITDRQHIGINFYFDRSNALLEDESSGRSQKWVDSAEIVHRIGLDAGNSISLALQNGLLFGGEDGKGYYKSRWEMRGIMRHHTDKGFYKNSKVELSYRRNFSKDSPDKIRLKIATTMRLTDKINFSTSVTSFFDFASQDYINSNKESATDGRVNTFFKTFRTSDVELQTGPELALPNGDSVYLHYVMELDAAKSNRRHRKGFAVGYSRSIDL